MGRRRKELSRLLWNLVARLGKGAWKKDISSVYICKL
jgi:hypothetical protein